MFSGPLSALVAPLFGDIPKPEAIKSEAPKSEAAKPATADKPEGDSKREERSDS